VAQGNKRLHAPPRTPWESPGGQHAEEAGLQNDLAVYLVKTVSTSVRFCSFTRDNVQRKMTVLLTQTGFLNPEASQPF
jgi:hypothetical protein